MNNILMWLAITIVLAILFGAGMLLGVVRKNLKLVILSVVVLGLSIIAGAITAYKFVNKSYNALQVAVAPKTGEELYTEAFGAPGNDCVKMIGFSEPVVHVTGSELVICFGACPAEVGRILSQHRYEVVKRPRTEVQDIADKPCCSNYFTRQRFGDTVLECMTSSKANSLTMYLSTDSTHVYYIDVRN